MTLRNELSEEAHLLTKLCWERGPRERAAGQGPPGELLCHVARGLRFHGDGINFWVVSGQPF